MHISLCAGNHLPKRSKCRNLMSRSREGFIPDDDWKYFTRISAVEESTKSFGNSIIFSLLNATKHNPLHLPSPLSPIGSKKGRVTTKLLLVPRINCCRERRLAELLSPPPLTFRLPESVSNLNKESKEGEEKGGELESWCNTKTSSRVVHMGFV